MCSEKDRKETFPKDGEIVTDNPKTVPPSGWGDSEHDTSLHANLKPHSSIPNYDPEWGRYRHEE